MSGQEVTDPDLLAQLNGTDVPAPTDQPSPEPSSSGGEVTDPELLKQLNADEGITGTVTDTGPPTPQEVQDQINTMLGQNRPAKDIEEYITIHGGSLNDHAKQEFAQYDAQRGNPNASMTLNIHYNDLGLPDQTDAVAHTNATPFQAATIGMGDTILMGNLDEATGGVQAAMDYLTGKTDNFTDAYRAHRDQNRSILRGLEEDNPLSLNAGRIGGALIPGAGTVAGIGKEASLLRNVGTAGALGAVYGQGSSSADTIGGQALDTVEGAGTGILGDRVVRGAGRVLAPAGNATLDALKALNITPTLGQQFGKAGQAVERAAGNIPFVGSTIRQAEQRQANGLEKAVIDEAAAAGGFADKIPDNINPNQAADYAIGKVNSTAQPFRDAGSIQANDVANRTAEPFQVIKDAREIAKLRTGTDNQPLTAEDLRLANRYTPDEVAAYQNGQPLPENPTIRSERLEGVADHIATAFGKPGLQVQKPSMLGGLGDLVSLGVAYTNPAAIPAQGLLMGAYSPIGQRTVNSLMNSRPGFVRGLGDLIQRSPQLGSNVIDGLNGQ